jgi:tRNA 2-thiouridine synthesizing protein E
MTMGTLTSKGRTYQVDSKGFLTDPGQWDEGFAEEMSIQLNMHSGLTKEHWDVILSIVDTFKKSGICPSVYEACRMNGLRLQDLRRLFPTGYLRGACKLAGMSSEVGRIGAVLHPASMPDTLNFMMVYGKTYRVDVRGFLMDPDEWDEQYAVYRAVDMKINGGVLTEKHWQIILFLRRTFKEKFCIPTVYDTCEANQIDLEELERLFPDGYHRGAVKIAGLRIA